MLKYKRWIILLGLFTLFLGCTEKKNSIAFENENPPQEILLGDSIFVEINGEKFFSFEDSLKNYQSNNKLIVANYPKNGNNNEARAIFRLVTLPDTVNSIDTTIEMTIPIANLAGDITPEDIKFGSINTYWNETDATWFAATDSTDSPNWENPGVDFEEISFDDVEIGVDTVFVTIPEELMLEWIADITENFGLVIYTETPDFLVEFYSSESTLPPKIKFDYTNTDDESVSFNKSFTYDTFVTETDDQYKIYPNQIIFSNIQPIRNFLKFELDKDTFGVSDSTDFKRITINKAELYFTRKEDNQYFDQSLFSIKPYIVLDEITDTTDESDPLILDDQYEDFYNITSADSLTSTEPDIFKVDISKLVQSFISDDTENNGILLRSIYESKDFEFIEFEPAVELRIIYTLPITGE